MQNEHLKLIMIGSNGLEDKIARIHEALKHMAIEMVSLKDSAEAASTVFKTMRRTLPDIELQNIKPAFSEIPFIDEAAIISSKAFKKLTKQIKKYHNIEPQTQSEIWSNKWNKKLKKKL